MKQLIAIFSFLCLTCANSFGQGDAKAQASVLLRQLVNRYQPVNGLSFDIMYKYAQSNAPQLYLDSVSGNYKISGSRYWYRIDSTESIRTGDYHITLFREDDIMYLARPSVNNVSADPLAMIDSMLLQKQNVNYAVRQEANVQVVSLGFVSSRPYKKIEYHIDQQTGYLKKMVSVVSPGLISEGMDPMLESENFNHAIVEMYFSNYQEGPIDNNLFDTSHYFIKQGTEYTTVAPFQNFKIFLGSTGL